MSQKLVIVESPAKAKTIKRFLGSGYVVEASMGHIRDLPKSQLGVDTENKFEPKYITIRGKGKLLANLKKAAKNAEKVLLATDPDREGEAISWHLAHILGIDEDEPCRIELYEITEQAVKMPFLGLEQSTEIWLMLNKQEECLTGWSDIRSVRFYGVRFEEGLAQAEYNLLPLE